MNERNRPDMGAPKKAMDRSAFGKDAPEAAESAAPIPDQLPASLYDRAIDLRYWGLALLGGALIWAILFKLI
jgi:hypothetical protein